jgi:hypothetical protein
LEGGKVDFWRGVILMDGTEFFDKQEEIRKKSKLYHFLGTWLLVAAIICLMIGVKVKIFIVIGFILLVCAFVFIGLKMKVDNETKVVYKKEVVEKILNRNFQDVCYDWNNGFTKEDIKKMYLLDTGSILYSEDHLAAKYKGIGFEQADLTIYKDYISVPNNIRVNVFRGRVIVIDAPQKTAFVRATSKKFYAYKCSADRVEMESVRFNKEFDVYAVNPQEAFLVFTPMMMNKIMTLFSSEGNIGVTFLGGKMYVAINSYRNAFESGKLRDLDYEEEVRKIEREIDVIKIFIDTIYDKDYVKE